MARKTFLAGLVRDAVVVDTDIREGRFQKALSLIAGLSGLLAGLEVAYEHYRGSYGQKVMYTPVIISPFLLAAGVWAAFSKRAARTVLPVVSWITLIDSVIGFGFHVRGIARKPGGWRLPVANIIMGPPIFAPLLFGIGGYLGVIASHLRRTDAPTEPAVHPAIRPARALMELGAVHRSEPPPSPPSERGRGGETVGDFSASSDSSPSSEVLLGAGEAGRGSSSPSWEQDIREGRFQKHLAAATAAASLFSGVEALYSHYKNNFQYWVQWSPVVVSGLLTGAATASIFSRRAARTALPLASLLAVANGSLGFLYHARGILRRPGGWKKPLYNIMYGPPILAPLLFAAAGALGLLATLMRREK